MDEHETGTTHGNHIERRTAPQQAYTMRDVGFGFVVAIIGMVIVFGIPVVTQL